ncbi:MAG: glycosyltransferase family 4 protein [Minwuia sp.]|nr:glycosyltransferase family 4 protein [Minwuia sp.]
MKLAILSSHPIQYNAPLFRTLASETDLDIQVFYCWEGTANSLDHEFNRTVTLDIPLLDGYDWQMVENISDDPGTHHFRGIDNPAMIERITDWAPDAILVYGWAWRTNLAVMRHFHGRIPVLFRGDSTLISSQQAAWKRWLRRPLLTWVYRHIDLALSPGIRNREYLRTMGVPDRRIMTMPHAIDIDRFASTDTAARERARHARQALGIDDTAIVFLFAGKFVYRKQVDVLITAFARAQESAKDIHLVLAGDGPDRAALMQQSAELPNIHFLGFRNQSEMPETYMMADVYVLPSVFETWGLGVNEALSAGCLAIASDMTGCAPDLLDGKPYGRVFRCGDADRLADAMLDLIRDRSRMEALGAMAASASEEWSIQAASAATQQAVRSIAMERGVDGK